MNVHAGGGKSLLHALLQSVPADLRVIALLDARMPLPVNCPPNLEIRTTRPTVFSRLAGEWWLARNVGGNDVVLCFGNLPALFSLRGKLAVFVQNRYLVDRVSLAKFSFKTRLRLSVERFWLFSRASRVHMFIAQTPSMQALTEVLACRSNKVVHVLPFAEGEQSYARSSPSRNDTDPCDFLYVASGEPHKNHRKLIEAWCQLAKEGRFPSLWLTLDPRSNSELCSWISEQKEQWGLRVENLGVQPHSRIGELFTQVKALIYPSTFESFGLPLIEARQAGVAVLAAELDYVRDVLDPEEAFDPLSAVSIARAVKRFMGWNEAPLPLMNAKMFLEEVLRKCE